MPFYEFKCTNCEKVNEELMTLTEYGSRCKNEILDNKCSCGGDMKRVFNSFNLGPDIYKNDPTSNSFWKKGKSTTEIAGILSDDNKSPY